MFENRHIDWDQLAEENGMYICASCGETLFSSQEKFDSKTGFPSFWGHVHDHVRQHLLQTYNRDRIQLLCHQCGQHLGHLFPDSRTPSQVRYCINADAIRFSPGEIEDEAKSDTLA